MFSKAAVVAAFCICFTGKYYNQQVDYDENTMKKHFQSIKRGENSFTTKFSFGGLIGRIFKGLLFIYILAKNRSHIRMGCDCQDLIVAHAAQK
jgi:hypothetical protein